MEAQLGDASSPQRWERGGYGQFLSVDLEGYVYLSGILRRNKVEIVRDAVVQQTVRKHRAHTVGIGLPAVQPSLKRNQEARCRNAVSLRSEEHTSELQSRQYLVCRLLL